LHSVFARCVGRNVLLAKEQIARGGSTAAPAFAGTLRGLLFAAVRMS
jgi:hypothetical protein